MAKALRSVAALPPPPPPPPPPSRVALALAAGLPALAALGLLQAYLFFVPANPASVALSFMALGAMVAQWAWLMNRGRVLAVAPWRAALGGAGVLLLMLAVRASGSRDCVALGTLALHAAAVACLYGALSGSDGRTRFEASAGATAPASAWIWLLGGSVALGLLTLAARWYANTALKTSGPSDAIFMFFQPRGSAYESIQGGPPPAFSQWAALGLYFAAALGGLAYLALRLKVRLPWLALWLLAAAYLGKLNIAYFSPLGLGQIGEKIAHVGTAYFLLVPKVSGHLWQFVLDFNRQQGTLGTHAETHPFGPELLYTWISGLVGYQAERVGLVVAAISLGTIVPVVLMAARYFRNAFAGAAAGALYLFTPQQLILSGAGTDCLVTMGLAWILYLSLRACEPGSRRWALGAGMALFFTSLISTGVGLPMVFVGLWVLWLCQRRGGAAWFLDALGVGGLMLAALLAGHLALWALSAGRFNYLQVLRSGLPIQLDLSTVRPYQVWVWLNPFLIGSYIGWPLVAVLLARALDAWRRSDGSDGLLTAACGFGLMVVLCSLGNAEAQRMFQYCVLVALLPATQFFLKDDPEDGSGAGPGRLRLGLLAAACALLFLNAALLEALVLDYW